LATHGFGGGVHPDRHSPAANKNERAEKHKAPKKMGKTQNGGSSTKVKNRKGGLKLGFKKGESRKGRRGTPVSKWL